MIRLLIIGRNAEQWAQGLGFWDGQTIEVDTETLPAAGLRNFAETSPDAIALAESEQSGRIKPIIEAIREKPLGEIVPVVLVEASLPEEEDLQVSAAIEAGEGAKALVDQLEEILGVDLEPDARLAQTASGDLEVVEETGQGPSQKSTEIPIARPGFEEEAEGSGDRQMDRSQPPEWNEQADHRDYVIEPLDEREEPAAGSSPGRVPESRQQRGGQGAERPSPEEIRRKLNEVRHEDYFSILEIGRNADGDVVRRAYRRLKGRFQPSSFDFDMAEKFEAELDEINDAFDDARAVLGDDDLREAYLAETTRK